jgi:predicted metal-dependent phosphoesterase TrpH
MRLLPGVELSATADWGETHILGYYIDPASDALQTALRQFRDNRDTRMDGMIAQLAAIGVPVDAARVRELAGPGAVGRPHLARALVEAGHVENVREAFHRYLSYGRPGYAPKPKVPPAEAIAVIRAAGGVPVLAHPFSTDDPAETVRHLQPLGLLGMEVWYGEYTPEQRGELHAIATGFGLIATGGSDFHGHGFKPGRDLGGPPVAYEVVERLADAANRVRAYG